MTYMYGACLGVCFVGEGLYFVILVTCNFVLCAVIHSDGIFTCVSSQINIVRENYCEVVVTDSVCELGRPVDLPYQICPRMPFATLEALQLKFAISTSGCYCSYSGFNVFSRYFSPPQWKASYLLQMLYKEL